MKILDMHFIKLPWKRKLFVIIIGTGYFLVGLLAYLLKLTDLFESFLFIIIGILFAEMIELNYSLEAVEKKSTKRKRV